jgi:hypothetical protein
MAEHKIIVLPNCLHHAARRLTPTAMWVCSTCSPQHPAVLATA